MPSTQECRTITIYGLPMPSRMLNSMILLLKHIGRLSMQGAHSSQRTILGPLQEIIESIPNTLNFQLISHIFLSLGVGFSDSEVEKLTSEAGRLAKVARDGMKGAKYVKVLGSLPPLLESCRPDKVITSAVLRNVVFGCEIIT